MGTPYRLELNFLPLVTANVSFDVFRRSRPQTETNDDPDVRGFSLPPSAGDPYRPYWVRLDAAEGFEPARIALTDNNDLSRWAMFKSLLRKVTSELDAKDFALARSPFVQELSLVMREHPEGHEVLAVQPYSLRATRQFGWLVDFQFRLGANVPFSAKVQQRSLSLNRAGKRNIDFYLDRFQRITSFVQERRSVLSPLTLGAGQDSVTFAETFAALPASRLSPKVYVFGGGRESRSQFNGLRDFGPLQRVQTEPKLLFGFREQDRHVARTLAMSLRGPKQPDRYGFPGFEALFKTPVLIDGNPIVLDDLTEPSFQKALDRVLAERAVSPGVFPVFVLPEGDDNGYMIHKALFTHAGIPSQVCTLPTIQDDYALKWAIGNIALQAFCKAGGQPWKVRPTAERALIVGISQSHKFKDVEGVRTIEKYFAFTVMTDNSGLFQRIDVLGESDSEPDYLSKLRSKLAQILSQESANYGHVVIHTSFKLKHHEIDAVRRTVEAAAATSGNKCRFVVVKVNHRSKFFAVNRDVNSLVPYEATKLRLGQGEYLVWFEGIFPEKLTVTKLFPGPTHLQFLKVGSDSELNDDELLQDLVNLSGANWRGFNAKSAPVSVFYCHLIADVVHEFHERNLPLPAVEDLRPWFL